MSLRVIWLFSRPYWWDARPGHPLTLRPATWLHHSTGSPS
ncbi:hypothetical protein QEH48_gp078 [Streptomyces phage TurkishDelight]|uniref:Uncharacterized protein n=1 Tax=Streptomyces phage TurkishDelight TaxID=2793708 RepID=A0A7T0Q4G4_9CAUD|nr:hypothetical protein QEH48_gp078 [Streptomyces phage TurkishDelight]QPL14107.1 hypothetical protein SEA_TURKISHDELIGHT_78 [Streptomyces phage TurkishDelight]